MTDKINIYRLLRDDSYPLKLTYEEWERAILALRFEGLLGRFAHLFLPRVKELKDQKLVRYLNTHLGNAITLAKRQNDSVQFECKDINRTLCQKGVVPLYLKGAAYSLQKNRTHIGRTYGDIDILVAKEQIATSERSLALVGWLGKEMNDYDDKYYREWSHEIPPLCHGGRGTVIDLHHNIVPLVSGRAPDISHFTNSKVQCNGYEVLSPHAMTLHSAIHLFLNEDFTKGLRDLCDLHLLFSEYSSKTFWADISELAAKTNFETELFLAMYFCQLNFDTPVCQDTMSRLDNFSKLKKVYWKFIFKAAVGAKHPSSSSSLFGLRIFLAYIRGHSLKMPVLTLIRHLTVKSWLSCVEALFGKSYFHNRDQTVQK